MKDQWVRLGVFRGEYEWEDHGESEELFIVVEGEVVMDFKEKERGVVKGNDRVVMGKGRVEGRGC